jgi:hypothetical protein
LDNCKSQLYTCSNECMNRRTKYNRWIHPHNSISLYFAQSSSVMILTKVGAWQGKKIKREINVSRLKHTLTSMWMCKWVKPNTPKWILFLGIGSVEVSWNFGTRFWGPNLVQIGQIEDHWKLVKRRYLMWGWITKSKI